MAVLTPGIRYGTDSAARDVLLDALDQALVESVRFRTRDGEFVVGGSSACAYAVDVFTPRFFTDVVCFGNLGLGEAYMRGDFAMSEGSLEDFLTLLLRSRLDEKIGRTSRLALRALAIRLQNALRGRHDAVQHHYDIGTDLFETFLDPTMTYTCGYARSPDDTVETLQRNKLERVCQKLRLTHGERMLDLGCGFGGLLMFAAERYGTNGVGVTLSRDQYEWANLEIARRGLGDRVEVLLMDYREATGTYDKVVSVGLLEHLSPSEYGEFFRKVAASLKPGSLGLVHAIGTSRPGRSRHDAFIQKYVFPSSHQIRLPALITAMEKSGFALLDVENMIRHYAVTALRWLERFRAEGHSLDPARYDETFHRMWEYWLAAGVAAARASDGALYQVLFHNDRAAPIPFVRV
ncbi:MAG TPA: class I SAM-dependent methyltransferase [Solirubrobacteraceae bacterium]|nr:class I SAM-dependent methyltransferase [Solirubrobacteraceae bacterium]